MGLFFSSSSATSSQIANANIMQKYSGQCNLLCNNTLSGADIAIINSNLQGGINITQSCSVNGQCVMNNQQNALTDVIFKASNSAAAGDIVGVLGADFSTTGSYQDINQNIQQSVSQKCNLSSINDMKNISIFAENSSLSGGIDISQTGSNAGSCTLSNIMSATERASGEVNNCSSSGKKAVKACGGKGNFSWLDILMIIGVCILIFFTVVVIYRLSSTSNKSSGSSSSGTTSSSSGGGITDTLMKNAELIKTLTK